MMGTEFPAPQSLMYGHECGPYCQPAGVHCLSYSIHRLWGPPFLGPEEAEARIGVLIEDLEDRRWKIVRIERARESPVAEHSHSYNFLIWVEERHVST